MRFLWAPVLLFCGRALAQAPATEAETMKAIEQLVRSHSGWSSALNTPGATLDLEEMSRAGNEIAYRLRGSGLPSGKRYTLIQWPVTGDPVEAMRGITFNETGIAICAGSPGTCGTPDVPNDPIRFVLHPALGEPFRIALAAENEPTVRALLKVVPVPNEGRDKGCRVQAVLLRPQAQIVILESSGFAAGAELTLESESAGERVTGKGKADAAGAYSSMLLPYVKGRSGGTTRVRLRSSACAPSVAFRWGK